MVSDGGVATDVLLRPVETVELEAAISDEVDRHAKELNLLEHSANCCCGYVRRRYSHWVAGHPVMMVSIGRLLLVGGSN